jgi:hypothetical protein
MTNGSFSSDLLSEMRKQKEAERARVKREAHARTDTDSGSQPIRYSIDGQVGEPDGTDSGFFEPVQRMVQDFEAAGEKAITDLASMFTSELNRYDQQIPEDCPIDVGGFLFWKNAEDLERVKAYKANKDRGILLAEMMKTFAQLGDFSHYLATEANQRMWERNRERPAQLQIYGELIRLHTGNAMGKAIKEMLTMYPDMSMALIARSTFKPKK